MARAVLLVCSGWDVHDHRIHPFRHQGILVCHVRLTLRIKFVLGYRTGALVAARDPIALKRCMRMRASQEAGL